jgi:hypothetical protein
MRTSPVQRGVTESNAGLPTGLLGISTLSQFFSLNRG